MYDNWLDSIEEKMGERFRFAVDMTITWTSRILSVIACVAFGFMDIVCFVGIFEEGIVYALYLILFIILSIVALFATFLSFGEDW